MPLRTAERVLPRCRWRPIVRWAQSGLKTAVVLSCAMLAPAPLSRVECIARYRRYAGPGVAFEKASPAIREELLEAARGWSLAPDLPAV